MHLHDPSLTPTPYQPGTTRRTWVRAAANVAWAAPLVSVATAAPALAAASTSTSDALSFVSAEFYLWPLGSFTCLDPVITVTNPTSRATGAVWIYLQFATDVFVGANTSIDPPTPSYVDLPIPSPDGSWSVATMGHSPGDKVVTVRLWRDKGLAAGETSTVGGAVNKSVPFGIVFANNPPATTVPLTMQELSGTFPTTAGSMTRIPRPA
jgi:hypothetical protein